MAEEGPAKKIATMADKIRRLSEEIQEGKEDGAEEESEPPAKRRGGYQLVVYHDETEKQTLEMMMEATGKSANAVYKEALRKWQMKISSDSKRRSGGNAERVRH